MKNTQISVVLGSYNRLKFLRLTIDSIRQELADISHEIIVIDGGSDDGSLEWLVQQKDIITIVQHNHGEWQGKLIERRSWGYFMNLGFKATQGTYVCMVSDDCLVVPGAFKNGIAFFQQERARGCNVGSVAFYWRNWGLDKDYYVNKAFGKLYVNHGMYFRQALEDVGYIDEQSFQFYMADMDLCLKLWQKGYECLAAPNSYIEHYPHANIKIRSSNRQVQTLDPESLTNKWHGIFCDKRSQQFDFMSLKKSFCDEHETGNKFKFLDRTSSDVIVLKSKKFIDKQVQCVRSSLKRVLPVKVVNFLKRVVDR